MDPATRQHARRIVRRLAELYPEARCSLDYTNPLQLLIATILSAQCTDARVNKVTPALFERFPDVHAFAEATSSELEDLIRTTGFFRSKARNILACCEKIVVDHAGTVPRTMEQLVKLAGVGRKTANVILGNAFDVPGLPVDTHVGRLSRRLGLSVFSDPVKVESDLHKLVPAKDWTQFGHLMIAHGRAVCRARRPECERCGLKKLCPYPKTQPPAKIAESSVALRSRPAKAPEEQTS